MEPAFAKKLVALNAIVPLLMLAWDLNHHRAGVNQINYAIRTTGLVGLVLLIASLAITPLRKLTGWNAFVKFRRMAGLYAFFYGSLHLTTYAIVDRFAGLDQAGAWVEALGAGHVPGGSLVVSTLRSLAMSIGADIYKRPFITIGFAAWLTMLPLAITSTAGWIRRLGGKRWNRLHRLVYLTGILGPLHYWWLVKADVNRPLTYAAVVALLLGLRIYWNRARRTPVPARARATSA